MNEVNTAIAHGKENNDVAIEAVLIALITAVARNGEKTRILGEINQIVQDRLSGDELKGALSTAQEIISVATRKL
ncbi:TPA: hypothetical protein QCI71_004451 [Enterobacter chuandaensis]|uniref:hypothetical protein n=1 Tax=Enterobacter TaxID=547 RepID=UPI0021D2BBDD|nr:MULTISPECIES: hypothetical protein [Enterobacter]MCI8906326.1 hypothetical protein [Enterobacter sp.]MCU6425466.1 hypothetical protein [Enterobacter sichuanensis]HDR2623509.1 hypothetical protein [Enterobacter chuandaensis]